ncbi:MAG TPA: hypothetical protein VGK30_10585 [Candidatus Binatia bacterium]|jgi:hypothetical protein
MYRFASKPRPRVQIADAIAVALALVSVLIAPRLVPAANVTLTAKDAGGAVLATNVENVPLGTVARPMRLGGNAFVPITLQDAGDTTCGAGRLDGAGTPCAAGNAREWTIETGSVANLPGVASLTIEVGAPSEVCDCTSSFASSRCCATTSMVATGSPSGGTHSLRFLLPPPSAGCAVAIVGQCEGAACVKLATTPSGTVLQLDDVDQNGRCEWPPGQTKIAGTLRFDAATPIEFSGNTTIRAGEIVVEDGGLLASVATTTFDAFAAHDLTLIATGSITARGRLDLVVADDLALEADNGDLTLLGSTTLRAADHATIVARAADVTIVAPAAEPGDVFGGSLAAVLAPGPAGNIAITGHVHVGSHRRVAVSNRTGVSVVGTKELRVADGAVLTTDQARTGTAGTTPSDVELRASGPIVVSGDVLVDSGRNIRIQSDNPHAQICLAGGATLEAARPERAGDAIATGRIVLAGATTPIFDDGTTTFAGNLRGNVQQGACGPAATPTIAATGGAPGATPSAPAPSATATPGAAEWRFYVRIARDFGTDTNVHVPRTSTEPPIVIAIPDAEVSLFRSGDQVAADEIAAADPDTLARLTDAAAAHIAGHPDDYPGFTSVVTLVWAERQRPGPSPTPTP